MTDLKQFIRNWINTFNRADAAGLAEFYHDDAINYQVPNEPVVGKGAIREMFVQEFAAADMVCIEENIFVDGDWAILEWKGPDGLMRGCGFFHIIDGRIKYQRGYWDKLTFLRLNNLPLPTE